MVLCVRMVCNCRRLIAERKVWRGYARTEPHGTRLRLPEDSKPYPLRLKKCQASHARHNERMLIMRRRRQSRATAARVARWVAARRAGVRKKYDLPTLYSDVLLFVPVSKSQPIGILQVIAQTDRMNAQRLTQRPGNSQTFTLYSMTLSLKTAEVGASG